MFRADRDGILERQPDGIPGGPYPVGCAKGRHGERHPLSIVQCTGFLGRVPVSHRSTCLWHGQRSTGLFGVFVQAGGRVPYRSVVRDRKKQPSLTAAFSRKLILQQNLACLPWPSVQMGLSRLDSHRHGQGMTHGKAMYRNILTSPDDASSGTRGSSSGRWRGPRPERCPSAPRTERPPAAAGRRGW